MPCTLLWRGATWVMSFRVRASVVSDALFVQCIDCSVRAVIARFVAKPACPGWCAMGWRERG